MTAHVSDWGDPSNWCHRGCKWVSMVTIFVGGVVLMFNGIIVWFLLWETYGAGVFLFLPEPIVVKLLSCSLYVKSLVFWAVFIHKIKIVLVIQVQIPSYVWWSPKSSQWVQLVYITFENNYDLVINEKRKERQMFHHKNWECWSFRLLILIPQ